MYYVKVRSVPFFAAVRQKPQTKKAWSYGIFWPERRKEMNQKFFWRNTFQIKIGKMIMGLKKMKRFSD
jgi:hypothetical protein